MELINFVQVNWFYIAMGALVFHFIFGPKIQEQGGYVAFVKRFLSPQPKNISLQAETKTVYKELPQIIKSNIAELSDPSLTDQLHTLREASKSADLDKISRDLSTDLKILPVLKEYNKKEVKDEQ